MADSNPDGDDSDILHIGMFGGGGVGKTCITIRYTRNSFVDEYVPTICDSFITDFNYNGKIIKVELVDVSGQDDFIEVRYTIFRNVDGFVLVFSVIDPRTLGNLEEIYQDMLTANGNSKSLQCAIACNKCDLRNENSVPENKIKEMAEKLNCNYFETSAKNGTGIKELFNDLIPRAYDNKMAPPIPDKKDGCCLLL